MSRTSGAAAGDGKEAGAKPDAGGIVAGDGKEAGAKPDAGVDGSDCPQWKCRCVGETAPLVEKVLF